MADKRKTSTAVTDTPRVTATGRTRRPPPSATKGRGASRPAGGTEVSLVDGLGDQVRQFARQLAGQIAGQAAGSVARAISGAVSGAVGGAVTGSLAESLASSRVGSLPLDAARLLLQALAAAGLTPARAGRAGAALRALREAAGLTVDEVSRALDLKDPQLIEQLEGGKVALPFELILRLAGVLGRNDPIGFVMKLTRSANPTLWRTLEDLGVGRLVVQGAREREMANIYRAHDAARNLSDAEFAVVLAFTRQAFESAMTLRRTLRANGGTKAASAPSAGASADSGETTPTGAGPAAVPASDGGAADRPADRPAVRQRRR